MPFPRPPQIKNKPLPAEFPESVRQKLAHPDRARRIVLISGSIGAVFGIAVGLLISLLLRRIGVPSRLLILATLVVGWFGMGWGMRIGRRIVIEALSLPSS